MMTKDNFKYLKSKLFSVYVRTQWIYFGLFPLFTPGAFCSSIEEAQKNQDAAFRQFGADLKKNPKGAYQGLESAERELDEAYARDMKKRQQEAEQPSAGVKNKGEIKYNPVLPNSGSNTAVFQETGKKAKQPERESPSNQEALSSENIPRRIIYPKPSPKPSLHLK